MPFRVGPSALSEEEERKLISLPYEFSPERFLSFFGNVYLNEQSTILDFKLEIRIFRFTCLLSLFNSNQIYFTI